MRAIAMHCVAFNQSSLNPPLTGWQACIMTPIDRKNSMTQTSDWLERFGAQHDQTENPGIFWASLLLLLVGVTGVLWSLPVPEEFIRISHILNWATIFLMAALIYYFIISIPLGFGMVPFVYGIVVLQSWISGLPIPLAYSASAFIGIGVAGLSFGHFAAGGLRAVFADVQLVMIAPIWLLSNFYRRLGIPY